MANTQPPAQQYLPSTDQSATIPRLMQIKVLYTFDDEKSTCLARCPYPVDVHTLAIDDNTQIGIVELRTCIQAIVTASPELIAKLGQDYTIYAYDYSEYETPLVGQGMLSWALASASTTPNAPAHQSQTPVTGRVVRNTRALFPNSGPVEMLQVRLRLVPVPTCLQSEYLASMQKYRNASTISSQGFDPSAWTAFLKAGASLPSSTHSHQSVHDDSLNRGPASGASSQALALNPPQPLPEQLTFQHTAANGLQPFQPVASIRKQSSRPGTPKARGAPVQSRPSSRNSNRGRPSLKSAESCISRPETVQSQEPTEQDNAQSRKRIRVEQADWHGPSAFEGKEDSLRVSASVAASVRGHKPPTNFASTSDMGAAEPGVRPPTPRPSIRTMRKNTSLAHETMTQKSRWYQSPYAMNADQPENSASVGGSPEHRSDSKASTPIEVPSSPPINRDISATPSSPILPRLAGHVDSGFVSGALDECLDADDEMRPPDEEDLRNASQYHRRQPGLTSELSFFEEIPGDLSLLPQKNVQISQSQRARKRRGNSVTGSSPRLPPLLSSCDNEDILDRSELGTAHALPQSTDELADSHANGNVRADMPSQRRGSVKLEGFTMSTESSSDSSKAQGGSGLKRKKAIQNRMNQNIAAGELPPYCHNCGEIDTPTWRKCFVKVEQGSPTHLQLSDKEDGLMAWEALSKSTDNAITSYRMIKKNLRIGDSGFEELKLCNACGMWLFKIKSMRPPHKWTKQPPKQPVRKRPSRSRSSKCLKEGGEVDAVNPEEAAMVIALTAENGNSSNEFALTDVSGRSDRSQPKSTGSRKRAASASLLEPPDKVSQLSNAAAAAALQRAIKSSPPKFPGSRTTPIELDKEDTADSVRRLLFPSPRKIGVTKTLGEASVTGQGGISEPQLATLYKENSDPQNGTSSIGWVPHNNANNLSPTNTSSPYNALLISPARSGSRGLTPRAPLSNRKRRSNPETPTRAAMQDTIVHGEMTPFTAQLSALISEGTSDPSFQLFGDAGPLPSDSEGIFPFSRLDNNGDDWGAMPQSDGDFFPVHEDADMEMWNGGPLLEGELDELLRDAGEDALLNLAESEPKSESQTIGAIGTSEVSHSVDISTAP